MGWWSDRHERRERALEEAAAREAEAEATIKQLLGLSVQMQNQVDRLESVTDRLEGATSE